MSNPRCSICGNSYGRWVCPPCKADPANVDWFEGDEVRKDVEVASTEQARVPWGEVEAWKPTELFAHVARLLVAGSSQRAAAAEAGCSQGYAERVAEEIGLCRKSTPTFGRHVKTLVELGMGVRAGKLPAKTP